MTRKYCRAYHLKDMRQFAGWADGACQGERELAETEVVFLWDDWSVVKSPITNEPLFEVVNDAWKAFCQENLYFQIPEDLHYAYDRSGQGMEQTHSA